MAEQKKGLIYKFIVGKDKDENYARSTLPSNRWELFKDILKGRFWKLILLNLMLIIALVPAALILFLKTQSIALLGETLNFSGSLFTGYPYMPGLTDYAVMYEFSLNIQVFSLLIVGIMFAGVIFSGVFYIVRNLVWSEGVFIANDFWKGLKSNILSFLFITFLLGVVLLISNLNISIINYTTYFDPTSFLAKPFVNNILKGLTYIFCGFFFIMTFFMFTITVTYKVKPFQLLKNSFYLTLGLLPRNLLFMALSLSPIILMFVIGGVFTGLLLGVMLLLGFSCGVLVWTIYSHWVFDKFLNDRVEGAVKNRGLYQKMTKDGKVSDKKTWFDNPKKKKIKPVTDEEVKITELPTNFSRADLAKLAAEKEIVKIDSEKWAEEHANDEDENEEEDDDSAYEGNEDAMKLEGYEEGMEMPPQEDETENFKSDEESEELEEIEENGEIDEEPKDKKNKKK